MKRWILSIKIKEDEDAEEDGDYSDSEKVGEE
jgi:hypothetical protein